MTNPPRHPQDDELFELIEGELSGARLREVQEHIDHCSACSRFVQTAQSGATALAAAQATMPADRARSMRSVLADEYELRHAGGKTLHAAQQPWWRRMLIPAIALVTLGALAGISIGLTGNDAGQSGDTAPQSISPPASAPIADGEAESAIADSDDTSTSGNAGMEPLAKDDAVGGTSSRLQTDIDPATGLPADTANQVGRGNIAIENSESSSEGYVSSDKSIGLISSTYCMFALRGESDLVINGLLFVEVDRYPFGLRYLCAI